MGRTRRAGLRLPTAKPDLVRKLTLAPAVRAFSWKGETPLTWTIRKGASPPTRRSWPRCGTPPSTRSIPARQPAPHPDEAKAILSEYFSLLRREMLLIHLRRGAPHGRLQHGHRRVGFVGRVLLNAFNALEPRRGERRERRGRGGRSSTYLRYGFTPGGLIREVVDFKREREADVYSIRRQSEGLYALLTTSTQHGRSHPR